jgi:hypothetical protein
MVKAAAGMGLPMQRLDLLKPARSVLNRGVLLAISHASDRKDSTRRYRYGRSLLHCRILIRPMSALGRVSRVSPVQPAMRNCTRDEGGPFEVGNQVLISSHRKLLLSKAMVVSVAETPGQDSGRQG